MSSLPPGCRFYPSDQQLLCYYLTGKNRSPGLDPGDANANGYDLIKELDLYDYEPSDLPENACYAYGCGARKKHWFCYAKLGGFRESKGGRSRRARGGFWRRSGRVRDVVDAGGDVVVGTRGRFIFYLGNSVRGAVRTEWILYEYALIDRVEASYVLCRIFVKSRIRICKSENMISSCAEESFSAVRHAGIQCDGFLTPDIIEAKVNHRNAADKKNYMPRYLQTPRTTEFDDEVPEGQRSVAKIKLPSSILSIKKLVKAPELPGIDMLEAETDEQLVSILEGDFIELDDLVD